MKINVYDDDEYFVFSAKWSIEAAKEKEEKWKQKQLKKNIKSIYICVWYVCAIQSNSNSNSNITMFSVSLFNLFFILFYFFPHFRRIGFAFDSLSFQCSWKCIVCYLGLLHYGIISSYQHTHQHLNKPIAQTHAKLDVKYTNIA